MIQLIPDMCPYPPSAPQWPPTAARWRSLPWPSLASTPPSPRQARPTGSHRLVSSGPRDTQVLGPTSLLYSCPHCYSCTHCLLTKPSPASHASPLCYQMLWQTQTQQLLFYSLISAFYMEKPKHHTWNWKSFRFIFPNTTTPPLPSPRSTSNSSSPLPGPFPIRSHCPLPPLPPLLPLLQVLCGQA